MTSRTPRRHRRLAFLAAGMAAAMVLLPGAASAQVVHTGQTPGATAEPVPPGPGDPVAPNPSPSPNNANAPAAPLPEVPPVPLPGGTTVPTPDGLNAPNLRGSDDDRHGDKHDDRFDGHERHDDTEDSDQLDYPRPPDHASGAVADIDLLEDDLLEITEYDATIEDDDSAHAEATVLGLGGEQVIGSEASSDEDGDDRESNDGDLLGLCEGTGGAICLNLLYSDAVAKEEKDSSLSAARAGVLALCVGGDNEDVTATYDCDDGLSLGVAEGIGVAERDKKHGHTKADSANELLNLCLGQREKLTESCDGLGLQAVHSESQSESEEPDTHRRSYLLGIDSGGDSTYLLDEPEALTLPDDCGDSALLCLFLNQGKSVIFENPKYKGAGSVQEALRLDVLNETLLVVLGQAESLAHETDRDKDRDKDKDHGDKGDKGDKGGKGEDEGKGPELAETGADVAALLAGGFLLTGLGALTVAATRRRVGRHTL